MNNDELRAIVEVDPSQMKSAAWFVVTIGTVPTPPTYRKLLNRKLQQCAFKISFIKVYVCI